jgi:hypothetical protein
MEKDKDFIAYVNKVKTLIIQLIIVDNCLREDDVVMLLLSSLPNSYSFFIKAI